MDLQQRLTWADQTFGEQLVMVTSFGPSSLVMLDQMVQIRPTLHVITIDTDFLFPETYVLLDKIRDHYPTVKLEILKPELSPTQQAQDYGDKLWETDPDLCCYFRKVVPLTKALADKAAWITGIRRDQAQTRARVPLVQWDTKHDLVKIAPVADWTDSQIWAYIKHHNLPYNALHDKDYPSIGCIHCTRPVHAGESMRAGRWADTEKTECGLHVNTEQHVTRFAS
jgi:phosphoadenosine phosphosulfate reductase